MKPLNAEFAAYYDVLRNESPVSLWVDYGPEPALNATTPIINCSLFTSEEPLGEGPQDTSV